MENDYEFERYEANCFYEEESYEELKKRLNSSVEFMEALQEELTSNEPLNLDNIYFYIGELCHHLKAKETNKTFTIARSLPTKILSMPFFSTNDLMSIAQARI